MNETNVSVPRIRMTKCTNVNHVHLHPNGIVGMPCGRKEETKEAGILICERLLVLTNGQLYKDITGISKTMKRNMQRKGLDPNSSEGLTIYRELRKPLRAQRAAMKKKKRDGVIAGRKTKTSSTLKPKS